MKRTFLAGLIVFLPIAITFFLARFIVDFLTAPFSGIIADLLKQCNYHSDLFIVLARLSILGLLAVFILILGYFTQRFFFKFLLSKTEMMMRRIPIVKSIYGITKDVVSQFLDTTKQPFQHTVLIDFPNKKSKSFAFFTGDVPRSVQVTSETPLKSVFIPTAPHPISGYVILCPEKDLVKVDISVEEVFKILISAGMYEPTKERP